MARTLNVKVKQAGDVVDVKFDGTIDENAAAVFAGLEKKVCKQYVFDLEGTHYISSSGIREWIRFLNFAANAPRHVAVVGARPIFIVALMNLPAIRGGAEVRSIYRTFLCPQNHRTEILADAAALKTADRIMSLPCGKCGEVAEAEDEDEDYESILGATPPA